MNLPRVLVVNPIPFNSETGSGITTSNLFKNWPKEKIAQIYSSSIQIDYSICNHYLRLPDERIYSEGENKFLLFLPDFLSGKRLSLGRWLTNLSGILRWCRKFSPEVIYSRPLDSPAFYCWLPRLISKKLNIPYVTHMMDDWPAQLDKKNGLIDRTIRKPIIQKELKKLLSQSSINIGISNEMCVAFSERYSSVFVPFQNCIELNKWNKKYTNAAIQDEFEMVYMGSVTREKELQSLIDIKEAVLSLRSEGLPICLSLYGPAYYEDIINQHLATGSAIRYMGFIDSDIKSDVLSKANVLVLPVNFNFDLYPYMHYSFQTKLPEYMASGTPILFYGPSTNPNICYANKHQLGLVVDHHDINFLKDAIRKLHNNLQLRVCLGNRAQQTAFKNHSCKLIRAEFEKLLVKVAEETKM